MIYERGTDVEAAEKCCHVGEWGRRWWDVVWGLVGPFGGVAEVLGVGVRLVSAQRQKKTSQIDEFQGVGVDMEVVEWWHGCRFGCVDVLKTCSGVGIGVLSPESSELKNPVRIETGGSRLSPMVHVVVLDHVQSNQTTGRGPSRGGMSHCKIEKKTKQSQN